MIVKDGPLGFTLVSHKDREFSHHLEVGNPPSGFIFPSVTVPYLRDDEELGNPMEIAEVLKNEIADFTCVIFQVQDNGAYPFGLDEIPMPLTSASSPLSSGLYWV